tara:strand:+ start:682 stop:906 length:225 start_codon:yes stop_codon:yes gene_type:complete
MPILDLAKITAEQIKQDWDVQDFMSLDAEELEQHLTYQMKKAVGKFEAFAKEFETNEPFKEVITEIVFNGLKDI